MTEKNYVLNVKTQLGTIFTVRGDSADELIKNISDVVSAGINDHVGALEELLLGANKTSAVAQVQASLGATVIEEKKFAPKAPPASSAPITGGKTCVHGNMVRRTGQGDKGEWRGFFCPTPKGTEGQCKPVFVRSGSAEWATF